MKLQVNLALNHCVGVDNLDIIIDVNEFFVKTSFKVNLETSNFQNSSFVEVLS